jgi:hypothetical protein
VSSIVQCSVGQPASAANKQCGHAGSGSVKDGEQVASRAPLLTPHGRRQWKLEVYKYWCRLLSDDGRICIHALAVSNPQLCERSLGDRVLQYLVRMAKQHVCSNTAVPLHAAVHLVTGPSLDRDVTAACSVAMPTANGWPRRVQQLELAAAAKLQQAAAVGLLSRHSLSVQKQMLNYALS